MEGGLTFAETVKSDLAHMESAKLRELDFARSENIRHCIARLELDTPVQIGGFKLSSDSKVIIDTPFRDNSIWIGDIFASGPAALRYVEDGIEAWKNSLLAIAYKQYKNGKFPSCVNLKLDYRSLSPFFDTYSMFWVVSGNDYIKKSKDKLFEKLFRKVLAKSMEYFSTRISGGLYKTPIIDMYWNWTILRKKKSTHANALFYKVLLIAEEFGLEVPIASKVLKENFNRYFWNGKVYKDRSNVTYLDGNSLALLFDMVPEENKRRLLRSLKYFETQNGVLSYKGKPFALTSWHKNIVCPFSSYIYARALVKEGKKESARRAILSTLMSGLSISQLYGKGTVPEFWKSNGKLGGKPILGKRRFVGLSLMSAWSAFGDLSIG